MGRDPRRDKASGEFQITGNLDVDAPGSRAGAVWPRRPRASGQPPGRAGRRGHRRTFTGILLDPMARTSGIDRRSTRQIEKDVQVRQDALSGRRVLQQSLPWTVALIAAPTDASLLQCLQRRDVGLVSTIVMPLKWRSLPLAIASSMQALFSLHSPSSAAPGAHASRHELSSPRGIVRRCRSPARKVCRRHSCHRGN